MKKVGKKILIWTRNIILLFFALSLFFVLLYKYVPVRHTLHIFAKNINLRLSGEKTHIKHQWLPLSEISSNLPQAVIASEDYLFLIHNGFDFDNSSLNLHKGARALYLDNTTISQQTARNVFLFPGKNYFNTILETYFTILIEFVWGKERIMEVYLNSIEMGNAIFGAEAIDINNFNRPAIELDKSECALIAASIINPTELDSAEPDMYLLRRQAKIMGIMEDVIVIEWNYK